MAINRRVRVLGTLAAAAMLAVVLVPGVEAQKVLIPGPFAIVPLTGQIALRSTLFDLTPQPLPQCSDTIDNDADAKVDTADTGCAAGPSGAAATLDDSELVPGFQAKVATRLEGSIDAAGNVTIPTSGIAFPPAYVPVKDLAGYTQIVTTRVVPTHAAVGTFNPITGDAAVRLRIRVALTGAWFAYMAEPSPVRAFPRAPGLASATPTAAGRLQPRPPLHLV